MEFTPILAIAVFLPIAATLLHILIYGTCCPVGFYLFWGLLLPLVIFFSALIANSVTNSSTEYLGGYVTTLKYYEAWDEEVTKTREVACGTDKDGNTEYCTETYTEIEDHPAEYYYSTNIGKSGSVNSKVFAKWRDRLADEDPQFIDMKRDYYSEDGDCWIYYFDGKPEHLQPVTYTHRYRNPFKHSNSIFRHRDISRSEADSLGLYSYPEVDRGHYQVCALTPEYDESLDRMVQRVNALLGQDCQFRMYLLIFDGTRTRLETTFQQQKDYWNGGNKNEFVQCIGLDPESGRIVWHDAFSWCSEPKLEALSRAWLSSREVFDAAEYCNWIQSTVPEAWSRREFSDFEYVRTTLPTWTYILLLLASIASCIGMFAFARNHFNIF